MTSVDSASLTASESDPVEHVLELVWKRARDRRHSAVVGCPHVRAIDAATCLRLIRVSGDVAPTASPPLQEARAQMQALLAGPLAREPEPERRDGDTVPVPRCDARSVHGFEDELVELCNRIADRAPSALVIDRADAADEWTLRSLARLVGRGESLRMPIVVGLGSELTVASLELFEALRVSDGDDAILSAVEAEAGLDGSE